MDDSSVFGRITDDTQSWRRIVLDGIAVLAWWLRCSGTGGAVRTSKEDEMRKVIANEWIG
jgi:hypothetical protein